jgi:hypothetical protein
MSRAAAFPAARMRSNNSASSGVWPIETRRWGSKRRPAQRPPDLRLAAMLQLSAASRIERARHKGLSFQPAAVQSPATARQKTGVADYPAAVFDVGRAALPTFWAAAIAARPWREDARPGRLMCGQVLRCRIAVPACAFVRKATRLLAVFLFRDHWPLTIFRSQAVQPTAPSHGPQNPRTRDVPPPLQARYPRLAAVR